MPKIFQDLTGQRFGRLVVLELTPNSTERGYRLWKCQCDCGRVKNIRSGHLVSRGVISCGCAMRENQTHYGDRLAAHNRLKPQLAAQRRVFARYRNQALSRNFVFNISFDWFCYLTQLRCHYCDALPSNREKDFVYNGLDRINSAEGYLGFNVISCCKICNRAKGDMSYDAFIAYLQRIRALENPPWNP